MQLDASDEASLRSVGAAEFAHAVVAMTEARETSIFATMALKGLGVGNVVAKAGSELHGAILLRVGADRVVYPEREMGLRVAHIFKVPTAIDYLDLGPRFGIVKARPPETFVGRSLGELDLNRLDLTAVALRRGDRVIVLPQRDQTIVAGDELILLGRDDRLDELGA
jgi:trk system potassium uptake protein TrkA